MLFIILGVLEFIQLFCYRSGYQNMDATVVAAPVNGDANVLCACPIGCDSVVIFDGLF